MGRIKIKDLPGRKEVSQEEMRKVLGGGVYQTEIPEGSYGITDTAVSYQGFLPGSSSRQQIAVAYMQTSPLLDITNTTTDSKPFKPKP